MVKNESVKQILAWKLGFIFLQRIQAPIMLDMIALGKNELTLDAGCGIGNLSYEMKKTGARVVGIDISRKSIRKAVNVSRFAKGESTFIVGSIICLPFRSGTFDRILLSSVLQRIANYKKALKEINRVLKTGGILVIVEMSDRQFPYLPYVFREDSPLVEERLRKEAIMIYHKWSARILEIVLKEMGFKVLCYEYSPKFIGEFSFEVKLIIGWLKTSRSWRPVRFLLVALAPAMYLLSKLDRLLPRETGGHQFIIKAKKIT